LGHNHNAWHLESDTWYVGAAFHRSIMHKEIDGYIEDYFSTGWRAQYQNNAAFIDSYIQQHRF
jgi:hypothetical protein